MTIDLDLTSLRIILFVCCLIIMPFMYVMNHARHSVSERTKNIMAIFAGVAFAVGLLVGARINQLTVPEPPVPAVATVNKCAIPVSDAVSVISISKDMTDKAAIIFMFEQSRPECMDELRNQVGDERPFNALPALKKQLGRVAQVGPEYRP